MKVIVPDTIRDYLHGKPDSSAKEKIRSTIMAVKLQEGYTEFKVEITSINQSVISTELSIFGRHIGDIQVSALKDTRAFLDKIIEIISEKYPEYPHPEKLFDPEK